MADIQSATAEIRLGKKKEEDRTNDRAKILCPHLLRRAAIMNVTKLVHQILGISVDWPDP